MQSEPNTQNIDPGEVGIAPETEPPGRIYKQVVREVLARIDQRLADIEKQGAAQAVGAEATASGARSARGSFGRRVKRGFIGLLLLAGLGGAAFAWQRYDGEAAKAVAERWTPQFVLNALATKDNQDAAQEPDGAAAGQAATDASATAPQQAMAEGDGGTTAAGPMDMAQLVQKMAHDIESLQQGIEQLKASQDQMSRDSAKAAEQFKASEDELIRMLLRVSEQNAPKTTGQASAGPAGPNVTARSRTPQGNGSQAGGAQSRTSGSPPRSAATRQRNQTPSFFLSRRPS